MEIRFICALWGMPGETLRANLQMAKDAGFDGVEMGIPAEPERRSELRALLDRLRLFLIAQQWTAGASPSEHALSFEEQYRRAVPLGPLLINSHTGRDFFSLEENLVAFRAAERLEAEQGIPVVHETHRGRPTFSVPSTMALLDALPRLALTADFSHWCCVHESLLEDQKGAVSRAVARTRHVHARVGHAEAPQVPDPRAAEWKAAVDAHLAWWLSIVNERKAAGASFLTVCPEFGPPPYLVTFPGTGRPIVDLWEVNRYMKDFLKERLLL
jgi:sugar phosphate isomerase/epimerase